MKHGARGRTVAIIATLCALLTVSAAGVFWPEIAPRVSFWWRFDSLGKNVQGYREYRDTKTGLVFVALPGGRFRMGVADGDDGTGQSLREHEVLLSPFMIFKYEVTLEDWLLVMREGSLVFIGDRLPVHDVSWDDCWRFCSRSGFQLPTEAQWEYACRAGGPPPSVDVLDSVAWHADRVGRGPMAVGRKLPNAFGLHDMQGNVWEWCHDSFAPRFYESDAATGRDPVCDAESARKVMRGGDWLSPASACSPSNRGWRDAGFHSSLESYKARSGLLNLSSTTVGFRVTFGGPELRP